MDGAPAGLATEAEGIPVLTAKAVSVLAAITVVVAVSRVAVVSVRVASPSGETSMSSNGLGRRSREPVGVVRAPTLKTELGVPTSASGMAKGSPVMAGAGEVGSEAPPVSVSVAGIRVEDRVIRDVRWCFLRGGASGRDSPDEDPSPLSLLVTSLPLSESSEYRMGRDSFGVWFCLLVLVGIGRYFARWLVVEATDRMRVEGASLLVGGAGSGETCGIWTGVAGRSSLVASNILSENK